MPSRSLWTLALWLCCLAPGAWGESLTLRVREASVVPREQITIGDVAEVQGDDAGMVAEVQAIVIGQAPAAGEERALYGGYLITRLKQHGFDTETWQLTVPEKLYVTRASQRLEARDLEAAIKRAIQQQMPWEADKMNVREMRGVESVVLPPGQLQYDVSFLGHADFLGPTSFTILLRVNGNVEKRLYGTAYIEVFRDVVTVVRALAKHEVITENDVRLTQVKLSQPLPQVVPRVADVVGKRAKRPLHPNAMLRTYEVEAQPVVRKGDIVLLVVESAQLKVTTLGEALEPGEEGATIRVRNTSSKREVHAIVVDSKTVRVPF
jgi:flagella basal body P-ring formation protein FlgA